MWYEWLLYGVVIGFAFNMFIRWLGRKIFKEKSETAAAKFCAERLIQHFPGKSVDELVENIRKKTYRPTITPPSTKNTAATGNKPVNKR